ncbi:MAG TPA: hypothetical protein VGY77_10135 [Gemmataceae bacterium]|nr:hypothetical protein [Gemmataceae bacterium]
MAYLAMAKRTLAQLDGKPVIDPGVSKEMPIETINPLVSCNPPVSCLPDISPSDLPPEWYELWEERAAIIEYDGKMPKEKAEFLALWDTLRRMKEAGIKFPFPYLTQWQVYL